jgi:xylulokinase
MISWQDNRTGAEMALVGEKLGAERFHQITGLPLNTTWILTKILWLSRNEPSSWKQVRRICQLQDYVLRAFGANDYYIDKAAVSLCGFYDLRGAQWSSEILDLFGLGHIALSQMRPSGTPVGNVSRLVSENTGLPQGTPLVVGAGDQNSAAIGAGVVREGMLSISLGTGGLVAAFLAKFPESLSGSSNIMNHAIDGCWELEGYQAGAASVYKWFRDQIGGLEKAYAESAKQDSYEVLGALATTAPAGARGLLFLPYLASACAPRWNPNARGTLLGLTFAHDKACLTRACIEGITLEVRDILESMYASGIDAKTMRILGGPTKSELWNQIQADVYNRRVETLRFPDAAILGAAILAGVGVGTFRTVQEAAERMVAINKVYTPNPSVARVYAELYETYKQAYEVLANGKVFDSLARLSTM